MPALLMRGRGAAIVNDAGEEIAFSAAALTLLRELDAAGDAGLHVEPTDDARALDKAGCLIRRTFDDIGRAHITLFGMLYLDASEG